MQKQDLKLHEIVIVGSTEGDYNVAKDCGVQFIEHRNHPLSNKLQCGIRYARTLDPDAILINGSDSMLTPNWCSCASKFIEDGYYLVGKRSILICKLFAAQDVRLDYKIYKYRKDPIGAGRMFSRVILDKMNWELFPQNLERGLDSSCFHNFISYAEYEKIALMDEMNNVFVIEVKSDSWKTITPYDNIISSSHLTGHQLPTKDIDRLIPGLKERLKQINPHAQWENT